MKEKKITAKEIDIVAKIRGIIEVKGYLGEKDNIIYGVYDDNEGLWVLDDGDMFSIKELIEEGYKVRAVTGKMIRGEAQKGRYTPEEIAVLWEDMYGENFKTEYVGLWRKLKNKSKEKAK